MNRNTQEISPVSTGENRSLSDLEGIIARALPGIAQAAKDRKQLALALLEIHDRRLYETEYPTFKSYLLQRWHLRKSRAYQMLHFARLLQRSTMVDTQRAAPANEREARRLGDDGCLRKPPLDLTDRAMKYLGRVFEKVPRPERPEFISWIRKLLDDMQSLLTREERADEQSQFAERSQTRAGPVDQDEQLPHAR